MKIKEIRAVSVNIPRVQPKSKSRRPNWYNLAERALPINKYPEFPRVQRPMPGANTAAVVWVQVTAEDGTWGLGQCAFGELAAAVVDYHFAPLLEGRDCLAMEYLNDLMWRSTQRFGPGGVTAVAQSGIDLALWDLKGKLLGQPVYSLLGGPCRDKSLLYATSDDLDWAMELGFTAFKVSNPAHYDMGIAGLNMVEEKIAKARDVVGPKAELMFNPVMTFNVEFTLRLAERLKPYGLRWLEEPLVPGDLEGHIQLKRAMTGIPLATGEDHKGRHAFRELVENRAVDVVQPEIRWCGGLSETVKVYNIAEAAGVITIPHLGGGTPFGQHFSIAMPESPMAEYFINTDPGVPLEEVCPIPGMPMPKDGYVTPSDAPGFGMEIRKEWIQPWDHAEAARLRRKA
ncbi:MAG: L-rhamnonate dehydratase [Chloroflexi bacterium]|nr:L-rhamnonate dehydratase [Chloroflexota bacterium]